MRRKITDVIEKWAASNERKALMITGSRQVGKTYSVEEFGNRAFGGHFLEINFKDNPGFARIFDGSLEVDELVMKMTVEFPDFEFVPGNTLIFLDEIQNCPQARTALKPLAKDGRYKVIASGSLLGVRMSEVSLHPTGYMTAADMHPMDFEEFLWAIGVPQTAIDEVRAAIGRDQPIEEFLFSTFSELYSRYMVVGGMPEAVKLFTETKKVTGLRTVFNDLVDGYMGDVDQYAEGAAKALIVPCLRSIPMMLAAENKRFVYSDVDLGDSGVAEGSRRTGFRYFAPALNWLSMAHITLTCNRVSEPRSPLEERTRPDIFKLYMLDTGVLTSLYDTSVFSEVFFGDPFVNAGAIAENAVAQAFAAEGRKLMYYASSSPRTEIDFVTVVRGKVCLVEVKSGENRECRSLNKIMGEYGASGIMFETRNVFVDDRGVHHYPLFAASFMDAIDPRPDVEVDLSGVDRLREIYG